MDYRSVFFFFLIFKNYGMVDYNVVIITTV